MFHKLNWLFWVIFISFILNCSHAEKKKTYCEYSMASGITGSYRATLSPVPLNIPSGHPSGLVVFTINNNALDISFTAEGLYPGEHMISINGFKDPKKNASCPDARMDKNFDHIIDINESRNSAGKRIVYIKQNMLDLLLPGQNPEADSTGKINFQTTVPWDELKQVIKDNDSINDFNLEKMAVIVHGINPGIQLPGTVGNNEPLNVNASIPVLCGSVSKRGK